MRKLYAISRAPTLAVAALVAAGLAGLLALGADGRLIERTATVAVAPDSDASAEASCPKGKRVVFGGLEVPAGSEGPTATHLKRQGKRRWLAGVRGAIEETSLTSIAYCAKLKGVKARTKTSTLPAQDPDEPPITVKAKCHRGERLAFGGFDYEPDASNDAFLSDLRRAGKRRWVVGAFNFSGTAPLTAIAYCSKHAPKTSAESETITLDGNESAELTAECGSGERLAFGGFSADVTASDAFVLLRGLTRTGARTWQVSALNQNDNDPGELTAYAYCERKHAR